MVEDLPPDLDPRDEVVHPVQTADERALAATRWPDHRGDHVLVDVQVDAGEGERRPVRDAEVAHAEDDISADSRGFRALDVGGEVQSTLSSTSGTTCDRVYADPLEQPGLGGVNISCRGGERTPRHRRTGSFRPEPWTSHVARIRQRTHSSHGARSVDRLGDFSLHWISGLAAVGVVALIVLIIYD